MSCSLKKKMVNFPLMLFDFFSFSVMLDEERSFFVSKFHHILCTDDPIAKRNIVLNIDSNSKPSTVTGDNQQSNLKVHACMCVHFENFR